MTINQAIEIQTNYLNNPFLNFHPEFRESLKLGIEALKQIKYLHEIHILHEDELLPGETEE